MRSPTWLMLVCCLGLAVPPRSWAQTLDHAPPEPAPLGELVRESDSIAVLEVQAAEVDEEVVTVTLGRCAVLKGSSPKLVRYSVWKGESRWARPGSKVVCFQRKLERLTCVGNHWYYNSGPFKDGDGKPPGWNTDDVVEDHSRAYVGSVEGLAEHVRNILKGRTVVVTARAPDEEDAALDCPSPVDPDWQHGQKGRVWRIQAGLGIRRFVRSERSPHFVGWGVGGPEVVPALVVSLKNPDSKVRAEAVGDLASLGPVARPARDHLRDALHDPDPFVRIHAAAALARVDPGATPELSVVAQVFQDRDVDLRRAAAGVLAALGPRARPAAARVAKVLRQDPEPRVRLLAAFALGQIEGATDRDSHPSPAVVVALAESLAHDQEAAVRFQAVQALRRLGAAAWPAVPALAAALRDEDPAISCPAADVLSRFDPPPVFVLLDALTSANEQTRLAIVKSLSDLGPRAWPSRPVLRSLLAKNPRTDESPAAAACALLRLDREASLPDVLPVIAKIARERNLGRLDVLAALGELGERARVAGPALAGTLLVPPYWDNEFALETLARIRPDDARVRLALKTQITAAVPDVRLRAGQVLWRMGNPRTGALVLLHGLEDPDAETRVLTARLLGELGPLAREAGPMLGRAASAETDAVRSAELHLACWRVQEGDKASGWSAGSRPTVIAGLLPLLNRARSGRRVEEARRATDWWYNQFPLRCRNEEDSSVEAAVVRALRLLESAPEPMPALENDLQAREPATELVAAVALCHWGRRREHALDALVRLLREQPALLDYAADTVTTLGRDARPIVPWLQRRLRCGDRAEYRTVLRLLQELDSSAPGQVWGVAALNGNGGKSEWRPTAAPPNCLWEDMGSTDAARSYTAACSLALAGEPAVPFLRARLRPARAANPAEITRLIAALDNPRFAAREQATRDLEEVIDEAAPALRQVLASQPSAEVRRRVEKLLVGLDRTRSPNRRRTVLAVGVLESVATPAACRLLRMLAEGSSQALLSRETKAALERLDRRRASPR